MLVHILAVFSLRLLLPSGYSCPPNCLALGCSSSPLFDMVNVHIKQAEEPKQMAKQFSGQEQPEGDL